MAKRLQTVQRNPDGNPKYRHIKPIVDSGASVTRYLNAVDKIRRDFKLKKNEIFRRIKVEVFVSLVIELNAFDYEESPSPISDGGESLSTLSIDCGSNSGESIAPCDTARSTLHSVVTGVGELDLQEKRPQTRDVEKRGCVASEEMLKPYLLLDVRDRDSYNQCHIITALSYPAIMLTRSINYESPALLHFKNKAEKVIILYDEDELVAPAAATTFVQRGYDNIYILSGGLKVACKRFGHGLVAGRPPASCVPSKGPMKAWDRVDGSNRFTRDDVESLRQQLSCLQSIPGNGSWTARSLASSSAPSERTTKGSALQRTPWK